MAANEDRTALWRTPLSTPLRSNENGFQDLFKHSEKLLASAVSICRLKGSVECQTGGIITVCEEMQRLLRLAFNETGRLEKELKKQRQTYDEEISLLKERMAFLEETSNTPKSNNESTSKKNNERLPLKPSTSENTLLDEIKEKTPISKVQTSKTNVMKSPQTHVTSDKAQESTKQNELLDKGNKQDSLIEQQNKMDEGESEDLSLEISVFDSPKSTKAKSNSKKIASNKKLEGTSFAKSRKPRAKKTILPDESEEVEEPSKEHTVPEKKSVKQSTTNANKKEKATSKVKESKAKKRSGSKLPKENIISDTDSANVVFDANDSSSSDVFLNPESGLLEMKECSETSEPEILEEQNTKPKKRATKRKPNTPSNEKGTTKDPKPKKNTKKEIAKQKKESPGKSNMEPTTSTATSLEPPNTHSLSPPIQSLPESPVSKTSDRIKAVPAPKASPLPPTNEPDEALGDMTFLIDISSMISSFVSSSESQQLELPLMLARERADARKLAGLFNLHISIGNKSDSRSSLLLSKTHNSQMPKPGKLDNLLSKLSIAAAKEAERMSTKARSMKRKPTDAIGEEDTDSQSKRSGNSRNKKAKI